jgi:hypothetical protein
VSASIKITLTPAEFADLRASAERAGLPFSVFARLCYRSGLRESFFRVTGEVTPNKGTIKHKVKAGVTLKIPANKQKTKAKK